MLRAIIVDDERLPIKQLERILNNFEDIEIVAVSMKPFEAVDIIKEKSPDIVFLDIEMPRINGIELADMIMVNNPETEIIFVTAYSQYALEAFDVCAIGYLLKPVKKEQLKKVIEHIRKRRNIKVLDNSHKLLSEEIIIQCFGKVDIIKNGISMNIQWRTAKLKELFAYYVQNRKKEIHRKELLEVLWGDMEYDKALVNLNTYNYQLKKQLNKDFKDNITVQYRNDYYKLNINNVMCDIDIFEDKIQKNIEVTAENINEFRDFFERYNHNYFEGIQGNWAQDERYIIEKTYSKQVIKLLKYLFEAHEYIQCIKYCKEFIAKDELDEQVWNILLDSLKAIGDIEVFKKDLKIMKKIFS